MQRIERYGVIALVFLLVTVAAVSFWGDGAGAKKGEGVARGEGTAPQGPQVPPASTRASTSEESRSRPEQVRPTPTKATSKDATQAPLPLGGASGAQRGEELAGMVPLQPTPAERASERREPEQPEPAAREERRGEERRRATPPAPEPEPRREARIDPAEMEVVGVQTPPRAATVQYVVKQGETLSGIALATLGSTTRWREIQALNAGLDPASLQAGRTILLPKGAVFAVPPGTKPAAAAPAAAETNARGSYVVKSGDVLSAIAERELGAASRWREIVELNPGLDPKRLLVGTKIVLPAASTPSSTTVAKATPERQPAREKEFRVR